MEIKENYSFQVDSDLAKKAYSELDNFQIEYTPDAERKYCILYFTSNNLYFPNTEIAFRKQFLEKNRYEWFKTRINIGYKHIFIRDIQKQWYLGGINSQLNTPEKLLEFLKEETKEYKVITLGSSAGGYAAIIFGQLLNAERIYSFNGQFEINSQLATSNESIDPIIFRKQNSKELRKWYDSRNFIANPSVIFYFQSLKSDWDVNQYKYVEKIAINRIPFNTSNHGIPFLSANLPFVLNCSEDELLQMSKIVHHPFLFSINAIGWIKTFLALTVILKYGIKKIVFMSVLKFKKKL